MHVVAIAPKSGQVSFRAIMLAESPSHLQGLYGQQCSARTYYASRREEARDNCTVLSSAHALQFAGWLIPVGLFQQFLKVLVSQTVSLFGLEDHVHPHGSDNVV